MVALLVVVVVVALIVCINGGSSGGVSINWVFRSDFCFAAAAVALWIR